jgi:phytoene synthase
MLAPDRVVAAARADDRGVTASADHRLDDCYRICREIARVHSKTFYLSSLFLAPHKRRAVWAVYAFCRTADDVVDRVAPPRERLDAIAAWERGLLDAYDGRATDPIYVAFADAARRFGIPIEPALDLLRGARMDVTVRRYDTYADLREYCYLVASTVGLLVLPVLGAITPAATRYGVALGRAMQMTNILRDVGEDARMDRIYLPAEDLRRFGCSEASIVDGVADERFRELMRFEIERVRTMYAEAEPGIALLAPESRYTVRLALSLYRGILDRIEANRYDVFTRRAHVPLRAKLLIALTVAITR